MILDHKYPIAHFLALRQNKNTMKDIWNNNLSL